MTITRVGDDRFYLGSAIAAECKDLDWLRAHVHADEDVSIDDITHDWVFLSLSGPASREILAPLTPTPLDNAAFPWLTAKDTTLADEECRILRVSFSGELGYELHMPRSSMPAIYDALQASGQPHGLRDIGGHALNSLRMEKGHPGSHELTPDIGLVEAGMLRFFKPDNRDFIGRDATLARIDAGPSSRMVTLAVDADDADCHGGEAVLVGDECVGMVSSGGYGHRTQCSYAFAFVRPELAAGGTPMEVMILDERRGARVLDRPAYDPDNLRPRA